MKQCHCFQDLHLLMFELLCCARLAKHPQCAAGCRPEMCYWALSCAGPAGQSHAVGNSTVGTLLVLVLMHPLDLKGGVFEKKRKVMEMHCKCLKCGHCFGETWGTKPKEWWCLKLPQAVSSCVEEKKKEGENNYIILIYLAVLPERTKLFCHTPSVRFLGWKSKKFLYL